MKSFEQLLIGHTGFVGSTLSRQSLFDGQFSRANIHETAGAKARLLVCSAAPAQKWIANRDPDSDLQNIRQLMASLSQIHAETAILVSTVDVFTKPLGVDEDDEPELDKANAYGANRRLLETEFQKLYDNSIIVRLPGLVGNGLRKNALFDLKHGNEIHKLNGASVFQFYPMSNLWGDITKSRQLELSTVHLTAEPVGLGHVASTVFGVELQKTESPVLYDFRTKHSAAWGQATPYQYDAQFSLDAIREYATS